MEDIKRLTDFLNWLQAERKAENTIRNYQQHLKKLLAYSKQLKKSLIDLVPENLVAFRNALMDEDLMNKSVNVIIGAARRFYEYLIMQGQLVANPCPMTLRLKCERNQVEILSQEEKAVVLEKIEHLQENIRLCFWTMFSTGARVSEVANLTQEDFEIVDDRLVISITGAKWNSDRHVPVFDQEIAFRLWEYVNMLENKNIPAFRLSKRTIQNYALQISEQTGIDFFCHRIRHSFAHWLYEQGIELATIQVILGHTTINMTKWYTIKEVDPIIAAPPMNGEPGIVKRFIFN